MEKVFVDTDIILDVLARRETFYKFDAHFINMHFNITFPGEKNNQGEMFSKQ